MFRFRYLPRAIGLAVTAAATTGLPLATLCDWRGRTPEEGELLIWGGGTGDCFGGGTTVVKLARPVEGLPLVIDAALGCCTSAAITKKGSLYGLTRRSDSDTEYAAEAVPVPTLTKGATSVAVGPTDEVKRMRAKERTDLGFGVTAKLQSGDPSRFSSQRIGGTSWGSARIRRAENGVSHVY